MRVAKFLMAAAAASLAVAPAMAAPVNPAAHVSVGDSVRAGTPATKSSQQVGGFPFLIVFVVIAAGLGLYFALDDNDDTPDSN